MRLPSVFHSIRFRLSVLSSVVVFALGSAAVTTIFFVIRHGLRNERVMGLVLRPGETVIRGGVRFIIPQLEMRQFQTVETVLRERILEDITGPILWGLFWMFLLSLVMGWFLAGRSLRPINRIREVAENIQAQDLTRRINLSGPDDELTRIAMGPAAPGWDPFDAALLRAVDELHDDSRLTDGTWAVLADRYDDKQLIELPMLVGQYHLVAFTMNTLRLEHEAGADRFPDLD